MLIHPHDGPPDDAYWRSFVSQQGFGHFVASGSGRQIPVIVPTQFVLEGDEVLFHLAAVNPVLAALDENPRAVMSVAGDWAFIPGRWKAIGSEDPRRGIPTTYYAAVQLAGTCVVHCEPEEIAAVLRVQLAQFDPHGDGVDPSEHGAKLRVIRGLRLRVEDVRAKFKYGGNVDDAHRQAVALRLAERNGPGDAAALRQMEALTSG